MPTNMMIFPYRLPGGGWAFDDPRHGLVAEALIEGADTLLDRMLAPYEAPGQRVSRAAIRFQEDYGPFPFRLRKSGPRNNGTDYIVEGPMDLYDGHRVWLCPALECYFAAPPAVISFMVIPWEYAPGAAGSE